MARYFFHGEDGICLADATGTELPSLAAAKDHAVVVLVEMLKGSPETFWDTEHFKIIVSDGAGLRFFELELGVSVAPVLMATQADRARGAARNTGAKASGN